MTETVTSFHLLSPLYASAAMRAVVNDRARLQRMLDFEAALARAEAALGVISASGVIEIAEACQADRYDIAAVMELAGPSGDIAQAVVNALTAEVGRRDQQAAGFVHWGASSQDIIDTALALELRAAIDVLLVDLDAAIKGFAMLAGRHRRTLSVARTAMQQALPMPFGLKLAGYAAALGRSRERLTRLRRDALPLQFGGAAGTLAALGDRGFSVGERLAALLDLPFPDAPWQAHRDRFAEVASAFAILAGSCGKIARDVALMMQTEVAEAFEPEAPTDGVSSTLPHQRLTAGAAAALSAATSAPHLAATILAAQVQEHEQGVGGWQTDWLTFPALALVTSGALDAVARIAKGIEIDVDRLRANLESSGGRIMAEAIAFALAEKIGRAEAQTILHELSQQAEKSKRPLKELLAADPRVKSQLTSAEFEKLFIPLTYQGSAQVFLERLAVASQSRGAHRAEPRPAEIKTPSTELRPAEFKLPSTESRSAELKLPSAPQLPPIATDESPAELPAEPTPPNQPVVIPPPLSVSVTARFEPPMAPLVPADIAASAPSVQAEEAASAQRATAPTVETPTVDADEFRPEASTTVPPPTPTIAAEPPPTPAPQPAAPPAAEASPTADIEQPERKEEPPPDENAPGAFMDVLNRAEAEVRASSPNKRSSS